MMNHNICVLNLLLTMKSILVSYNFKKIVGSLVFQFILPWYFLNSNSVVISVLQNQVFAFVCPYLFNKTGYKRLTE